MDQQIATEMSDEIFRRCLSCWTLQEHRATWTCGSRAIWLKPCSPKLCPPQLQWFLCFPPTLCGLVRCGFHCANDRSKGGGGRRRRRRVGWQVKFGWKSFLQKLSPMTVARSGTVVTARKRTCGQDRSVEGVRQTFVGVARQTQASCVKQGWSKLVGSVIVG